MIIPAAGQSRRMGSHKLLLPLGPTTVIGNLLESLARPEIAAIHVVCRAGDLPLQQEVRRHGGQLLIPPIDPPDMRSSVEFGLKEMVRKIRPVFSNGWILIPADHPLLSPATLSRLFVHWISAAPAILVPTFRGKRGHPALFSWETAAFIPEIPPGKGMNWILREAGLPVEELEVDDPLVIEDMDAPDDYDRIRSLYDINR